MPYSTQMPYSIPKGGMPLRIKRGVVDIARKYEPEWFYAKIGGANGNTIRYIVGINKISEDIRALGMFGEGDPIAFQAIGSKRKVTAIRKDLEKLVSTGSKRK